ncbi:glycoside hydrolase family 99-like domain-containing protein [Saccharothrix sp. HUAS TT1]|uniref:glycoside hydrolase family 99-like domain-containing protein n=1 Tax=unclassified Saccharothrix TaxID=2593673 RepID=UPI00345BCF8E
MKVRIPIVLAILVAAIAPVSTTAPPATAAANAENKVTDPVPLLELHTPGDAGLFWTLSQAEAQAAVTSHGMRPHAGARVGYLRRAPFTGSQPIHRLRKLNASAYLLTASTSERDQLTTGANPAFRYEGVVGHASATAQPGTEVLYRMRKDGLADSWRPVLASRAAAMQAQGYVVDGPLGHVHPRWIRTGAIYFGVFDANGNRSMMDRVEQYYGPESANDWWGGVRHAHDRHPKAVGHWPDEDFSHLKPAIGYYDDARPETVERQIAQAAGLDHFAFYWYWNPAAADEQLTTGLHSFLAARNRSDLKFTVLPCIHPWGGGAGGTLRMPSDQITRAAQILVDDYLSQPNALRANDGRPMLQLCDVRGIGKPNSGPQDNTVDAAAVRHFTDAVRTRARATLGEEVLITMTTDNGTPEPEHGLDDSYCPGRWDHQRGSYENYVAGERDWFATQPGPLVRCATSDFDERPRIGVSKPDPVQPGDTSEQAQAKLHASFRWYEDQSLPAFRRLPADIRTDLDESTRPSAVDNVVLLYAWNEWHEGGVIEPNARDGCAYLDAVRAELRLTKGTGCTPTPTPYPLAATHPTG